jgi:hypothetical protein
MCWPEGATLDVKAANGHWGQGARTSALNRSTIAGGDRVKAVFKDLEISVG